MLTVLTILPFVNLILSMILTVMCFIIRILIAKENVRWDIYKSANIIVESFEMYDKGLLSEDKNKDIKRFKDEYEEQYEAYKAHKYLKDKFINLMTKSGLFSFISLLLCGLFYIIRCGVMQG